MSQTVRQRSRLLRAVALATVVLAALAFVGLVVVSFQITRVMPAHRVTRIVLFLLANLFFSTGLAVLAALYVWVHMAHSLPDLMGWHLQRPASEFSAADAKEDFTLNDYRAREDRVFAELDAYSTHEWAAETGNTYNRFNAESESNPKTIDDGSWNRTRIAIAENPVGGALLIHGLSDSPYSLRSIGQRLHREGYTVVWLRVPGHGTNPRALAEVTYEDWVAAVQIAMRGLRELVPAGLPLIVAGYSNGGALCVNYALEALKAKRLPKADALLLFSPMIGINPLARITRLYHAVGLISSDEKLNWSDIYAEIDPFKYNSWPMNGNVQAWRLTRLVERKLAALEKSGRMHEVPPILAMQSVVDSTVAVPKLITVLFDRLTSNRSELFLFDVNRMTSLSNLVNLSFERTILPKLSHVDRPFKLTVMGNKQPDSRQLTLKVRDAGQWTEQPLDLYWPEGVVSLSHVAVPFPPSDPVYGNGENGRLSLGAISMRAEPNALMIPSDLFARCRHNPFYDYMEDRVVSWLRATTEG